MILNHMYSKKFCGVGSYEPQPQVECRISSGTKCMSISLRVFLMRMWWGGCCYTFYICMVRGRDCYTPDTINKILYTHTF